MGHFSVETALLAGQLSAEINSQRFESFRARHLLPTAWRLELFAVSSDACSPKCCADCGRWFGSVESATPGSLWRISCFATTPSRPRSQGANGWPRLDRERDLSLDLQRRAQG